MKFVVTGRSLNWPMAAFSSTKFASMLSELNLQ
jgi:hypothetical protein